MTSPDPTVATVRLLSGAATSDATDDDIAALLTEEDGIAKLAAADLLELMAGRLQSVTSDEISVDDSKQAAVLMARAAALREQHYTHGGDFFFDTAATGSDPRWSEDGYTLGWGGYADGGVI